ncbi:MAG: hypothetical protein FJ083_02820 [Cyanobacteria bacterium K_Offshore_surface_m2_239]|nr:hypothetical protein [Cyanobacteria bacterium K_Offshore_surface_m2_239]
MTPTLDDHFMGGWQDVPAERAAERLAEALVGDDVLAIDHDLWQAMAHSPSPHWRAIHARAIRLVSPLDGPGGGKGQARAAEGVLEGDVPERDIKA